MSTTESAIVHMTHAVAILESYIEVVGSPAVASARRAVMDLAVYAVEEEQLSIEKLNRALKAAKLSDLLTIELHGKILWTLPKS